MVKGVLCMARSNLGTNSSLTISFSPNSKFRNYLLNNTKICYLIKQHKDLKHLFVICFMAFHLQPIHIFFPFNFFPWNVIQIRLIFSCLLQIVQLYNFDIMCCEQVKEITFFSPFFPAHPSIVFTFFSNLGMVLTNH